ncbi:MAG: hypothetical protein ACUVRK_03180 [Spirochaetota bacterium]
MLHRDIKECLDLLYACKKITTCNVKDYPSWQLSHKQQMIFKDEAAAQLGGPYGSLSLTCLYNDVVDGRLTLIGNEKFLPQSVWGRLTLVSAHIDDEHDYYTQLQELTLLPLKSSMEGVMIRIQPSEYKEWIRIHKDYLKRNNVITMMSQLYQWYKQKEWVKALEFVVITSNSNDVAILQPLIEKHKSIIKAFGKRLAEDIKQCDSCDNNALCKEINSLFKGDVQ